MQIQLTEEGDLLFTEIDPLICTVLRQIASSADPENHEGAMDRLFGDPVPEADPQSEEINEEWAEYVRPELRTLFQTTLGTVNADLEGMEEKKIEVEDETFVYHSFRIPGSHLPAWINALTQARIVLAERHGFNEEELENWSHTPFRNLHEYALLRMEIYGEILSYLIQILDAREGREEAGLGE